MVTRSQRIDQSISANKSAIEFGSFIRDLREKQGLMLCELALQLGISAAYLSRIERGKENPPRDDLVVKACTCLNADSDLAFIAAHRLPPDMRTDIRNIVAMFRLQEMTA